MKTYNGLPIIMGISKLHTLEIDWSIFFFAPAIISKVTSRFRFTLLLRFLHVNSIDPSQIT